MTKLHGNERPVHEALGYPNLECGSCQRWPLYQCARDEKDGKLLGRWDIKSPTWVGFKQKTGAVYVESAGEIVKFAASTGKAAPTELGRMKLPVLGRDGQRRVSYILDMQPGANRRWHRSRGEKRCGVTTNAPVRGVPVKAFNEPGVRDHCPDLNHLFSMNRNRVGRA